MLWVSNYINGASYSSDGVMNEFYNKCVLFWKIRQGFNKQSFLNIFRLAGCVCHCVC